MRLSRSQAAESRETVINVPRSLSSVFNDTSAEALRHGAGWLHGEGAGILVIKELSQALAPGATARRARPLGHDGGCSSRRLQSHGRRKGRAVPWEIAIAQVRARFRKSCQRNKVGDRTPARRRRRAWWHLRSPGAQGPGDAADTRSERLRTQPPTGSTSSQAKPGQWGCITGSPMARWSHRKCAVPTLDERTDRPSTARAGN